MNVEGIGICGSILILASMIGKSTSVKGNIAMRILNLLGSMMFVVYGFFVPAYATAGMNIALVLVNLYHWYKLMKEDRKRE